jgi:hypothetical protein
MQMSEAKEIIKAQGWTPRIVPRRNGIEYLYAARWNRSETRTNWRYIGAVSKVGEMTEEKIIAKINRRNVAIG